MVKGTLWKPGGLSHSTQQTQEDNKTNNMRSRPAYLRTTDTGWLSAAVIVVRSAHTAVPYIKIKQDYMHNNNIIIINFAHTHVYTGIN